MVGMVSTVLREKIECLFCRPKLLGLRQSFSNNTSRLPLFENFHNVILSFVAGHPNGWSQGDGYRRPNYQDTELYKAE
jgi:hypothetical protein